MEQTRLFLALALSLGLMFAYQELVQRRNAAESTGQTALEPSRSGGDTAPGLPDKPRRIERTKLPGHGFRAAPSGQEIVVSTDRYIAHFTPRGARLIDFDLKDYKRDINAESPQLDLVAPAPIMPLTVSLGATSADASLRYTADKTRIDLTGDQTAELVFRWVSPSGKRTLEKKYRFDGSSYRFDVAVTGKGLDQKAPSGISLTPLHPDGPPATQHNNKVVMLSKHKIVEHLLSSLTPATTPPEASETEWVGFSNQYFLMALTAPNGSTGVSSVSILGDVPTAQLSSPTADGISASVYAGPREQSTLTQAGSNLNRALDFGWFWFVAVPLLQLLRMLSALTGNYGVAIVLLTALVKLVMVPLSQSSFKNMREMQKLQPQIERLRERFKDDQMALQKETMELYRRHKVNPLSGCLPMVLQLPVFVGLYNALSHAIELRHAPFMLWIHDLSAPERLMVGGIGIPVLTVIMGGTMLVQQLLTPQQGDQSQRMVMMIMPVVFTYMFIDFPAGLVLYWLVSNVLSISQQYYVTRAAS